MTIHGRVQRVPGSGRAVELPRIEDMFVCVPDCPRCLGSGHVCEEHPDKAWDEGDGCCGAPGVPCRPENRGSDGITPRKANLSLTFYPPPEVIRPNPTRPHWVGGPPGRLSLWFHRRFHRSAECDICRHASARPRRQPLRECVYEASAHPGPCKPKTP